MFFPLSIYFLFFSVDFRKTVLSFPDEENYIGTPLPIINMQIKHVSMCACPAWVCVAVQLYFAVIIIKI